MAGKPQALVAARNRLLRALYTQGRAKGIRKTVLKTQLAQRFELTYKYVEILLSPHRHLKHRNYSKKYKERYSKPRASTTMKCPKCGQHTLKIQSTGSSGGSTDGEVLYRRRVCKDCDFETATVETVVGYVHKRRQQKLDSRRAIRLQLTKPQRECVEQLAQRTGWNYSEVLRSLVQLGIKYSQEVAKHGQVANTRKPVSTRNGHPSD